MDKKTEIIAIDYVEFYVGNANLTSLFYQHFWGFDLIAYAGPETGSKEVVSYVLRQSEITLVISSSLQPENPIANHVALHGDSVKRIAFHVVGALDLLNRSVHAGVKAVIAPDRFDDENGYIIESSIHVYGDTLHTFIERDNYRGIFRPGYVSCKGSVSSRDVGLTSIDHITANIEAGTMDYWINFYRMVFNYKVLVQFDENDIFTEHSAMKSKVVMSEDGKIKLPFTEPINKKRKSQIQEFIDYNMGAGVQHLAFNTSNMVQSVGDLTTRGITFLNIPDEYYDTLSDRVNGFEENIEDLRNLMIMIDQEDEGFLLQSFTKPVLDRPTYFIELIERKGSASFGKGNVKALFAALVKEQEKRKNI